MTPTSRVLVGDCRDLLPTMEAQSVHCVVTSPPYFSLRSYLDSDHPDKARELGSEAQLDCLGWATGNRCSICWICHMVEVFAGVWRVLRDDGTAWVNVGDSYSSQGGAEPVQTIHPADGASNTMNGGNTRRPAQGIPAKNLCLQPYHLALALQADGWYVRSQIIWAKTSPMPESVRDRPTSAHETVWLLSKQACYWYDAEAVREQSVQPDRIRCDRVGGNGHSDLQHSPGGIYDTRPSKMPDGWNTGSGGHGSFHPNGREAGAPSEIRTGRNLRNVWTLSPEPFPDAHFATYPTALVRPCILAGTSAVGCCPHCGAGWRRVVEKHGANGGRWPQGPGGKQSSAGVPGQTPHRGTLTEYAWTVSDTLGWQPGCDCPHTQEDCVPATVLDPFCGSGTTGVVCAQYGRSFIGVELSEEYAAMARKRIAPALAQPCLEVTL